MTGIAIQVNDTFLDLDPGASINVRMECPIFDRAGFERTYSYPFKLPTTPTNLRALGFANRLDAFTRTKRAAKLYLDGQLFRTGVLRITGSGRHTINATFQNDTIDFLSEIRDLELQDVDLTITGLTNKFAPDITLRITNDPLTTTTMIIRINGTIFAFPGDNVEILKDNINVIYPGLASVVSLDPPYDTTHKGLKLAGPNSEDETLTIELQPVIDPVNRYFEFHELQDDYTRILSQWDTWMGNGQISGYSVYLAPIYAPNFYDEKNDDYSGYINYLDDTGNVDLTPGDIEGLDPVAWPNTIVPLPQLYYVLQQLAAHFGFQLAGSVWNIDELKDELVICAMRSCEYVARKDYYVTDTPAIDGIRLLPTNLAVQDFLPEMTITEFFTRIADTVCAFVQVSEGRVRFQLIEPLLAAPPQDWTEYAEPDYAQSIDDSEGYALDYADRDSEIDYQDQLLRITTSEDAVEFVNGNLPFLERSGTDDYDPNTSGRSWLTPYTSLPGSSDPFDLSNRGGFRLLFYRGLWQDNQGNKYPLATTGRHDVSGAEVGSYTLRWEGDDGLYENFWKSYIRLMTQGRTVTYVMRLPIAEILNLAQWKQIVKKIYHPDGEFVGVVKEVSFKANTSGIGLAEVTFQRL